MKTGISWLDLKLGARVLLKHPALTIVGGIGMAVGVAMSVGFYTFGRQMVFPTIPLDEGDRIVAVENRDRVISNEVRQSLHDFVLWRDELTTIDDLAAFRTVSRNLIPDAGTPELVQVAEMTAAGFRVARVQPLLGRYLTDEDESPDAPPVVVIGHDVWRTRFASRPDAIGRTLRLSGTPHTIIGVMPEGFAFPENHSYWTAFRADPSQYARRDGPSIFIFGRLADGATMERAQAELSAIGARTAAAFPESNGMIEPMVMPYTHSLTDVQGANVWTLVQMQLMMSLLLVIVALNVAVLVYARTAMRHSEIVVRTALGASRARVVGQLFAEALVLSLGASAVGLVLAQVGVGMGLRIMQYELQVGMPFWMDFGLSIETVLLTVGLAVFAAVIVGVLPALQATGRGLAAGLRTGGTESMRLGRTWSVLIVAQVAIAVATLPAAVNIGYTEVRAAATQPVWPTHEFISAFVAPDPAQAATTSSAAGDDGASGVVAFGTRLEELMRRLDAEPQVAGVSYRASLPGWGQYIEVDGVPAPLDSPDGHLVRDEGVGPGYLRLLGANVVAGRDFSPRDFDGSTTAVIVNRAFVRHVLHDAPAIGRRIRPAMAFDDDVHYEPVRLDAPWYEIVGVIDNLERNRAEPELVTPQVLYPAATSQLNAASLAVRMRGEASADFATRFRQLAMAVDPTLYVGRVLPRSEFDGQDRAALRLVAVITVLVLLSVFLLSAAGVYALTSFTVTRRRREIGIRAALGAHPRHVLGAVFARTALQIGLGIAIGVAVALALEFSSGGEMLGGRAALLLPVFAGAMALVGLIAALGPARRGLRGQPTEALRQDV